MSMKADEAITTLNAIIAMPKEVKTAFLKSVDGKEFFTHLRGSDFYRSWKESDKPLHKSFIRITDALSLEG